MPGSSSPPKPSHGVQRHPRTPSTAGRQPHGAAPSTRPQSAPAPASGQGELTVDQLSARTGVSVRNIRAYQTAGLMPPPRLQGRVAYYDAGHQGKLELVRDLRQQGFRLDTIRTMLTDTPNGAWSEYALISGLFSTTFFTVEKPQRKAISEMASHWATPATPQQKARLSENGLYRPIGPDEVEMLSPALERIGIQLAELDVPLDTVLDLQDELIKHSRAIAKAYVEQLFLTLIKNLTEASAQRDAGIPTQAARLEAMRALFERLRPLAIGSVSAAFPVLLQQEFDRSVHKTLKKSR
ncbi:MAG: MerR family transcriptional regulator [Proteobacteria bacterium]|uniref:MerR family transcriptional regulator n=1 Tax=Aquabacterium sp. TaxID=1872578 RepID=UPI0035C77D89|nr:MerR family transcriptional regulator [Pseudomonadota bacterium]